MNGAFPDIDIFMKFKLVINFNCIVVLLKIDISWSLDPVVNMILITTVQK